MFSIKFYDKFEIFGLLNLFNWSNIRRDLSVSCRKCPAGEETVNKVIT